MLKEMLLRNMPAVSKTRMMILLKNLNVSVRLMKFFVLNLIVVQEFMDCRTKTLMN